MRNSKFDFLPSDKAIFFAECYRGQATWEEVNIAKYDDGRLLQLRGVPILVECGEAEILVDQIQHFVERSQSLGLSVTMNCRADMVHVFQLLSFTGQPQCLNSLDAIRDYIAQHIPRA